MIFLHQQLATHRRGRFLSTLLRAEPIEAMPESGLYLIIGKDFQGLEDAEKHSLFQWTHRPGRTLLLLPPFEPGYQFTELDWISDYKASNAETPDAFVKRVKNEVNFEILGEDGEYDPQLGHQWIDHSINTRFFKAHSGTGVFAVTCLPLWSISLLDEAPACLSWLKGLTQHAGKPTKKENERTIAQHTFTPSPQHYSVLVCVYAWETGNVDKLRHYLVDQAMPIMDADSIDLAQGIKDLSEADFLNDTGLTTLGTENLIASPYWGYAEQMRGTIS